MSHYSSNKTAWSESFGVQTPLWPHLNLKIAHMKLQLTTWLWGLSVICHI